MFKYWWQAKKGDIQMNVAFLIPRWLVYWASVRLIAHATTGKYSSTIVPEITAMDALKRWDEV